MTMTSRERLLAAINHETCDRVPTDIWATDEVWAKLVPAFGETRERVEPLRLTAGAS